MATEPFIEMPVREVLLGQGRIAWGPPDEEGTRGLITICPVCSEEVIGDADRMGGTLMELYEDCKACGLYDYAYAYGNTKERIGFVWFRRSYRDTPEGTAGGTLRRWVMEETRLIWADPHARPFLLAVKKLGLDDHGALGVLADWLEEVCPGRYPHNQTALRAFVKELTGA